jgi:nucleotide-binding universal stress UspA family protein
MIAYDGTDNAKRAVEYGARFLSAEKAVIVTAWEPMARRAARISGLSGVMQPEWAADEETHQDVALIEAKALNQEGVELAKAEGLNAEGSCAEVTTTIWNTLIEAASAINADLIVTGTRGNTGMKALMQSSVADHVLKHGHRPVLVVPPGK